MKAKIIRIGNSKGVRIPKPLLDTSGLDEEIEIRASRGKITIVPVKKRRSPSLGDAAMLSEAALAKDWDRPDEDEAWKNL